MHDRNRTLEVNVRHLKVTVNVMRSCPGDNARQGTEVQDTQTNTSRETF